eukprot:364691-Chlamydomonas_euryale.AAC.6
MQYSIINSLARISRTHQHASLDAGLSRVGSPRSKLHLYNPCVTGQDGTKTFRQGSEMLRGRLCSWLVNCQPATAWRAEKARRTRRALRRTLEGPLMSLIRLPTANRPETADVVRPSAVSVQGQKPAGFRRYMEA